MNGIRIQRPPNPPQVAHKQVSSGGEQAEFLTLRLLHKRNRVQLSQPFANISSWPNRLSLLSIANHKGWFAVATKGSGNQEYQLQFSPISDLRSRFTSEDAPETERLSFSFKRVLTIAPYTPIILKFICQDARLVAASAEGILAVYDSTQLLSEGINQVAPLHAFEGMPVRDIQSNPGDTPQLIAVMRGDRPNTYIEIVDIQSLSVICTWTPTDDACITSMSWSLKGKQIALGLSNGDVVTYSPAEPSAPKFFFPGPQISGSWAVVGLSWISKTLFYVIMADNTGTETENCHFICSHEGNGAVNEMKLDPAPCPPFGAMRPSGPQIQTLRDWNPFKNLIFLGDGPSSEMALIGNAESKWFPIILDESSIPNLPLDEDMNDTAILGFDIDLTSTTPLTSANDENVKPPAPILFLYASDGTVVSRHIVNDSGGSYPGMMAAPQAASSSAPSSFGFAAAAVPRSSVSLSSGPRQGSFDAMQDEPPTPPTPKDRDMDDSTFSGLSLGGSANTPTSNKPNSMFGSSTTFSTPGFGSGVSSAFGSSAIKPPTSAFGAAVNTGDSNPFAAPKATDGSALTFGASGFGTAQPNKGFGFSGQASTANPQSGPTFGSSGFGAARAPAFGSSSFGQTVAKPMASTSGGFGAFASSGSGFGSFASASPTPGNSIFSSASSSESANAVPADPTPPKPTGFSAFSSGGGGFGAAANNSSTSIFSNPSTEAKTQQDSTAPKSAFSSESRVPFSTLALAESKSPSPAPSNTPFAPPKTPTSPPPEAKQPVTTPLPSPAATPQTTGTPATPSDSLFRAGTGFSAFGVMKTTPSSPSPLSTPTQPVNQTSPFVSAFGPGGGPKKPTDATDSGAKSSAPTFGQSSFGNTSLAPAFGSASFGFGAKSSSPSSADSPFKGSSAFSAFSSGSGAFGIKTPPGPIAKAEDATSTPETSPLRPKEASRTPESPIKPITTEIPSTAKSKSATPPTPESPFEPVEPGSALGSSFASVYPTDQTKSRPESSADEEEDQEGPPSPEDEGSEYEPHSSDSTEDQESEGDLDSLLDDREETPTATDPKRTEPKKSQAVKEAKGKEKEKEGPPPAKREVNKPAEQEAVAAPSTSKPAMGFNWSAAGMKPPTKGPAWTCSTCMISNPESAVQCVACEAPGPGAATSPSAKKPDPLKLSMPAPPASFNTNTFGTAGENTPQSAPAVPSSATEGKLGSFGFGSIGLGRPSTRPTKSSPLTQTLGQEKQTNLPSPTSTPTMPSAKVFGMPAPPSGFFKGFGGMSNQEGSKQPVSKFGPSVDQSKSTPRFGTSTPSVVPEPKKGPVPPPVPLVQTPLQKALSDACEGMFYEFEQLRLELLHISTRHAASDHGEGGSPDTSKSLEYVKDGLQELQLGLHERETMFNQLESDLLKQQIHVQHIKLLSAAVKNKSFKQMAESRPLDPDQQEKQGHLRKASKDSGALVQQIENKLANIRVGLEAQKNGRINLKTPSLASIDNTCIMLEANIAAQAKRLDSISQEHKANPLRTPHKHTTRRSSNFVTEAPQTPNTAAAKRAAAALDSERANQQLRMNLRSMMQQPLLTTRVVTLEEAAKKRDSGSPIFKQVGETEAPAPAPVPQHLLEQPLPPLNQFSMQPLPSLSQPSIPPPNSWIMPDFPPASSEPITPPQQTAATHHRRTHNSSNRPPAVVLPVPGSSPKTPPTFAPPSNFSWGAIPTPSPPPSNALGLSVSQSPSPSSNIKFGLGREFRPRG